MTWPWLTPSASLRERSLLRVITVFIVLLLTMNIAGAAGVLMSRRVPYLPVVAFLAISGPFAVCAILYNRAHLRGGRLVVALRSRICPKCCYQLVDLPDEGRCPECGRPYTLRDLEETWERVYGAR